MKVRFAPSPTGFIHVGNCRTALVNWLFARKNGGKFLLRLDDTDLDRCDDKYTQALFEDWKWLGLDYDEFEKQSDRLDLYNAALKQLKASGRLYPCYETPEELEFKRKLLLKKGRPPIYDREALTLSEEKKAQFEAEGRKPHWRFRLEDKAIEWHDMTRGPIHFHGSKLSDPILVRENGSLLYTLASVVDDIDLNITHILRGEDHVSNTAIQIQLIEALGGDSSSFHFAHFPLLAGEQGEGLSKRLGSLSIQDMRADGILPMALNSILGKIGTSDAIAPYQKMVDLIDSFDLGKFSRATPKFSMSQLELMNKKILHEMSYADIMQLVTFPQMDEAFWEGVKRNIDKPSDIETWWNICHSEGDGSIEPEDKGFIEDALSLLPPTPWTETPWDTWIQALKDKTGRKGKGLFMPLRLAMTGQSHGPELKIIMGLLGHDLVQDKLKKAIA